MNTEWRVIPSYPNYMVNEFGEVKRKGSSIHLKQHNQSGYNKVSLWIDNKVITRFVHIFVAEAFIGPKPKGHQTHHKDHNKQHNHYTNLEYVITTGHLNEHIYDRSKLTHNEIITIRLLFATDKHPYKQLALMFHVSLQQIYYIVKRKVWKHI